MDWPGGGKGSESDGKEKLANQMPWSIVTCLVWLKMAHTGHDQQKDGRDFESSNPYLRGGRVQFTF